MAARRAGRPRKDPSRQPPRASDLLREKRACAATGRSPQLAELDRDIYAAWASGDQTLFVALEKRRAEIERDNLGHAGELAATPLGMMLAKGMIDPGMFVAGETYEKNQKRLGKAICGHHETRSHLAALLIEAAPAVYYDLDPDRAREAYERCRWVEREVAARCRDWRMVDAVIVRGEAPAFLAYGPDAASVTLANFKHDLKQIERFYAKPPARPETRGGHRKVRRAAA